MIRYRELVRVGEAIASERRRRGMTQAGLAELADVAVSTVVMVETARCGRWSTVVRIASSVGLRVRVDCGVTRLESVS